MYKPQTANTSGSPGRNVSRFVRALMPGKVSHTNNWKKKDSLNSRQREWRIKRVSQKAILWLLLFVVMIGLVMSGYMLLLRSDIFRMTAVSVQGNQVTNQQQILKAGKRGQVSGRTDPFFPTA